jgi:CheY-like chemotaxis protein/two-component sensor histidine kinase
MLAAGVAHEINNPLAYLTAALEFLAHRPGAPDGAGAEEGEVRQALDEAREGAARVRHVVRDLTTFSRMNEERRARVEVEPILDSAIHMARNELRHRARLVKQYGGPPAVLANEARLGQLFLNLLINAAQAIPEGHVEENEIRVVTATDAAGRAVVEVHDSGPGIPAAVAHRIFDPFFTTKPKGVGTGLGLSICRSIVVALGGEISAESRPESPGATFRVVLPAARCAAEEEARTPVPPPAEQGRRGRVLVVDDEPVVATALRRLLAPEHEVTVVTRAEDARDAIARGERFDVIVCDLMMPQMTGMELHAELEVIAPEQARRMVVMTGGAFTDRAREFLDRVALPRFEKPFDSASLRATVRGLVASPPP